MRFAGQPSWGLSLTEGGPPLVALVLRQMLALDVAPEPVVPPALEADVPIRHGAAPDGVRAAWSKQWPLVFADVVRREGDSSGLGSEVVRTWASTIDDGLWEAADRQADVIEADDRFRTDPGATHTRAIGEVAREIIATRGIDPERVQGSLVAVPVRGPWWHLIDPGRVVCSWAALTEPESARGVIRMAVESGLDAEPGPPTS
ncbi:hypothetical protein [Ruania alba]|uniref:Uncharacterized protein n=1 Tax=Ruania alba TaxID=648782 RepID=A0A1H5HY97_9MICO|nr:hypothetical protein [Ruania alba]SEE32780.1 hypothetical protein SAMN04488554_2102 [Ruania alba]